MDSNSCAWPAGLAAASLLLAIASGPAHADASADARAVGQKVLALVNQARSRGAQCGGKTFARAAPLRLSPSLERAAAAHARDMADHRYLSHDGRDAASVADRVTRAGYRWRAVGENIAAGARTPEAVVKGWLESPGHCANIMNADYREMGVAYAVNAEANPGIYWTQVFAAPRGG